LPRATPQGGLVLDHDGQARQRLTDALLVGLAQGQTQRHCVADLLHGGHEGVVGNEDIAVYAVPRRSR